MIVPLKSVELWKEVRGPGNRNQSDVTAGFQTYKVKAGEKDATPTGLSILWDQEAHAVYILNLEAKQDPAVIVGWENVRRAIPEAHDWMALRFLVRSDLEDPKPETRKGK